MKPPKRLVYFGSPQEAVPPLMALVEASAEAGFEVQLVVTNPDKPKGRGQKLSPTPVKEAANSLGLQVSYNPADAVAQSADLGIVVAYGKLIKDEVLKELDLINMHFSLLPRWRGAAPVERAILAGDQKTGVCLMAIESTLDTGPVYARCEVQIENTDTTQSLKDKLVRAGTELLIETLKDKLPTPVAQSGEPTWAEKIKPEELELDWNSTSSSTSNSANNSTMNELLRRIRVGGAWVAINGVAIDGRSAGKRLKILEAAAIKDMADKDMPIGEFYISENKELAVAVSDGVLSLKSVQQEGKKAMAGADWFRGRKSSRKKAQQ